jgi:hypothetical protein
MNRDHFNSARIPGWLAMIIVFAIAVVAWLIIIAQAEMPDVELTINEIFLRQNG